MSQAPARAQFPLVLLHSIGYGAGSRGGLTISAGRSKKRPLTLRNEFLQLGNVSEWTDWLALTGFVWLSYSQHGIFRRTPEVISLRFRLSRERKLPTPDRLNRP